MGKLGALIARMAQGSTRGPKNRSSRRSEAHSSGEISASEKKFEPPNVGCHGIGGGGTWDSTLDQWRVAGRRLAGHAAVFSTPADIGGRFRETIMPGAFRATLAARSDVVALVDHDATRLLARTASGTLRLSEDARGLAFELDVPATQLVPLHSDFDRLNETRLQGG